MREQASWRGGDGNGSAASAWRGQGAGGNKGGGYGANGTGAGASSAAGGGGATKYVPPHMRSGGAPAAPAAPASAQRSAQARDTGGGWAPSLHGVQVGREREAPSERRGGPSAGRGGNSKGGWDSSEEQGGSWGGGAWGSSGAWESGDYGGWGGDARQSAGRSGGRDSANTSGGYGGARGDSGHNGWDKGGGYNKYDKYDRDWDRGDARENGGARERGGWDEPAGRNSRSGGREKGGWEEDSNRGKSGARGKGGREDEGKGKGGGRDKGGREDESRGKNGGREKGSRDDESRGKGKGGKEEESSRGKGSGKKDNGREKGGRDDDGKDKGGSQAKGGNGGKEKGGGKCKNGGADTSSKDARGKESGGKGGEEKPPAAAKRGSGGTGAVTKKHLSSERFSELPVSNETRRALAEGFGYDLMTEVQAATIHPLLRGEDVVARAKTGTGKTLAFLVPIVERIRGKSAGRGGPILSLVLSPTRELAQQIFEEARTILGFHSKLGAACFYGGTNIKGDKATLDNQSCDILVATPGRMQDHLDNTSGFRERLQGLIFLALDEADQLLDMGFRDSILAILRVLPDAKARQGALFSATFPPSVNEIAKFALKKSYSMLDTVRPDEEVTPDQIEQCCVVTDLDNMMETLYWAVTHEMKAFPKHYKIMVFFVTARLTQLYSEQFEHAGVEVLEIHSRKSQAHRTRCSDQFRNGQCGIIFSSDVLARGLDMPDVTAVIQVGVPSSRDQYIHRLGRTGRAGKSGRCTLLLHDFERYFLKQVKDLPVKNLSGDAAFPKATDAPAKLWEPPNWKTGGQAYQAFLGYYNSAKGLGLPKDELIAKANHFAETIGMVGEDGLPPPILKKTVGKMGLKGVNGLNIVATLPYDE